LLSADVSTWLLCNVAARLKRPLACEAEVLPQFVGSGHSNFAVTRISFNKHYGISSRIFLHVKDDPSVYVYAITEPEPMPLSPIIFQEQFQVFRARVLRKSGVPFASFREGIAA
jgi:hypothetical protein